MEEIINYKVRKQEDGWYLATADLGDNGSLIVEGEDYASLKQKVLDFTEDHLEFCRRKEIPIPQNLQIRLTYSEFLFENPGAERIFITGNIENGGYRARTHTLLNLDLYHQQLDDLKKQLLKEIQQQGHHDKHVEFRLEEVL